MAIAAQELREKLQVLEDTTDSKIEKVVDEITTDFSEAIQGKRTPGIYNANERSFYAFIYVSKLTMNERTLVEIKLKEYGYKVWRDEGDRTGISFNVSL